MEYSLSEHGRYRHPYEQNLSAISGTSDFQPKKLKPLEMCCPNHPEQPCSNYCKDSKCYQLLCSECIQSHLAYHKKHSLPETFLPSLRSVRIECIEKLTRIIEELSGKLSLMEKPKEPQTVIDKIEGRLELIKTQLLEIIEQEFMRLRQATKAKISESFATMKSLEEIHGNLEAIINQLKEQCVVINQGIFTNKIALPDALSGAYKIDERSLFEMYEKQIHLYLSKTRKLEFEVGCNPEHFRQNIFEAVKIITPEPLKQERELDRSSQKRSRSKSARKEGRQQERMESLKIGMEALSNNKILHFFESGSSLLHLIYVDEIKGQQFPTENIIKLRDFTIPQFHASLVSQYNDCIYLSGGIIELGEVQTKSPLLVRFSLKTQTLKKDFARVKERSSHTIVQGKVGDYIYILGGYKPKGQKKEPEFELSVERVSCKNGEVKEETPSNWGGSNIAFIFGNYIIKACEEGVEAYQIKSKEWLKVDVRVKSKGQFIFYRNPGHCTINESTVLVYGGYDDSDKATDLCFIWRIQEEKHKVRIEVSKTDFNLQISEGFSNNPAIVDSNHVYAAQNIDDGEDACLEGVRRIICLQFSERGCEWLNLGNSDANKV